jgi:hypothetical protein
MLQRVIWYKGPRRYARLEVIAPAAPSTSAMASKKDARGGAKSFSRAGSEKPGAEELGESTAWYVKYGPGL